RNSPAGKAPLALSRRSAGGDEEDSPVREERPMEETSTPISARSDGFAMTTALLWRRYAESLFEEADAVRRNGLPFRVEFARWLEAQASAPPGAEDSIADLMRYVQGAIDGDDAIDHGIVAFILLKPEEREL